MDSAIVSLLASLGPYAAFGALALWIIRGQDAQIKAERDRNERLVEKIIPLALTAAQASALSISELKAALK